MINPALDPIIAVVGSVTTASNATTAGEDLGRELAKGGFRIVVYGSDPAYLEPSVVKGYVASGAGRNGSIQVRYSHNGSRPAFPEQKSHPRLFEYRPEPGLNWEISFYQSLSEVQGILLLGGGASTMIAGLVAMGHRIAILALASFGGKAADVWNVIRTSSVLASHEEIALMARPDWSTEIAQESVGMLRAQLARWSEEERQRRLGQLRSESVVKWHALTALILFVLAILCVPYAWSSNLSQTTATWLLFLSPLLAGVAGATIRLVFDSRQGSVPLNRQSAVTTAALGLVAGGVAGLLFITAQVSTLPDTMANLGDGTATNLVIRVAGDAVASAISAQQASRLVPFGVVIGFIAGLTLDAVFRKLVSSDVVDVSRIEVGRSS